MTWWCSVISRSHGNRGRTTDEALQERRVPVGAGFGLFWPSRPLTYGKTLTTPRCRKRKNIYTYVYIHIYFLKYLICNVFYLHKYVIVCPPWMYMNVPVFVRPHAHIYICACVLVCTRLVGRNRLIPPELRHCWNLATGARGLHPQRGWLPRHIHYQPRILGWIKNSCCLQQQKAPR